MTNQIKHVAIIMDGNGRWATSKRHPRFWGHIKGSSVVSQIVERADDLGLSALTLFAFSTENWQRPRKEISVLFKLLKKYIIKERQRILSNNIRFKVVGDISDLPDESKNLVFDLENESKYNTGLKLNFAFGYGGRSEIVNAVNQYLKLNPEQDITEDDITKNLFTPESGDVDLLIRTGGEQRISNFLLWQTAYAELYFTNTLWPDFTDQEFTEIISDVSKRERRFGGVNSLDSFDKAKNYAKRGKSLNFIDQEYYD